MGNTLPIKPGDIFGRLVIVREVEQTRNGRRFLCRCSCGAEKEIHLVKLSSGNTQSCGCLQREHQKTGSITHGLSKSRLYRIWSAMKYRCFNPRSTSYPYYGARGISVCSEWLKFEPFCKWALECGYNDKSTIERIEVDGNYEPSNCKWISSCDQSSNTRKNLHITYLGETKILKDWAVSLGIKYSFLYKRICINGWPPDKAFTTPAGMAGKGVAT